MYNVNFSITRLFSTHHLSLIDAIYFANCVNWDAAYDPKHSAITNIPIYWIIAEIKLDFPTGIDANGQSIDYEQNTQFVPISCYGLVDVAVNSIKDWFKLSPHCKECRFLRARLQKTDEIEVFMETLSKWTKGVIVDVIIIDNNEQNQRGGGGSSKDDDMKESIVEYLTIQTVDGGIIRYNRYDDRVRPLLNTQNMQTKSMQSTFRDELLCNVDDINEAADDNHQQNDVQDVTSKMDQIEVGSNENVQFNEELFDEFDPANIDTMKSIQTDLDETMQTMKKLALRRTVYNDVFRPVHLICPKYTYRTRLDDENDVNMSVVCRNTQFDYVQVKMIDVAHPQLSEMNIFMTPRQLFEHTTTYFHFGDMKPPNPANIPQKQQKLTKETEIVHNVPPPNACTMHEASQIHNYIKSKDLSTSPQRNRFDNVHCKDDTKYNGTDRDSENESNPRSHLEDDTLQSFLHGVDLQKSQKNEEEIESNWMLNGNFRKSIESVDSMQSLNSIDDKPICAITAQQEFINAVECVYSIHSLCCVSICVFVCCTELEY